MISGKRKHKVIFEPQKLSRCFFVEREIPPGKISLSDGLRQYPDGVFLNAVFNVLLGSST